MSKVSDFVWSAVEKLIFHLVTITQTEAIGGRFRRARLQGDVFKGVKWVPGQAVQFYLGDLTKRAYTPMEMESDAGTAELLFYMHGGGPGATYAGNMKPGDRCNVMRPKNSLNFTNVDGHAIFFGDETSVAAAYALQTCAKAGERRQYVLEVTSVAETIEDFHRMMDLRCDEKMITLQIDSQMVKISDDLRKLYLGHQSNRGLHIGCAGRYKRQTCR